MSIKDILAKIQKGESLTDAEQATLAAYDPEKEKNDAAAAARRRAEDERDAAKAEADRLNKLVDDTKKAQEDAAKSQMTEAQRKDAEFKALQDQVAALTKERDVSKAAVSAAQRSQSIRDAAKAAGIALAPKTVSEGLFYGMLETTLSGVDISDKAKIDEALGKFKAENPGIIAAPGAGSGVNAGDPSLMKTPKNPWAKDSFNLTEQVTLCEKDPQGARALAAEAGVKLD